MLPPMVRSGPPTESIPSTFSAVWAARDLGASARGPRIWFVSSGFGLGSVGCLVFHSHAHSFMFICFTHRIPACRSHLGHIFVSYFCEPHSINAKGVFLSVVYECIHWHGDI